MEEGDDHGSWENLIKGLKKLPKKPTAAAPPPPRLPFRHPRKETPFSPPSSWINASPLTVGATVNIDKSTSEKLKRGKFEIEGRLDLHGYTADAAHQTLQQFIFRAFDQGKRCVLIITGKGLRPDGTKGIIRENVPRWLNEPEMRQRILVFRYAKVTDGGEGALYVLLRRQRP